MGLVWRVSAHIRKQRSQIHKPEMIQASSTSMTLRVDFDDEDTTDDDLRHALTPRRYKILFCRTVKITGKASPKPSKVGGALLDIPFCNRASPAQRIVEADTNEVPVRGFMPDTEYKFWVEGFYCDGTSSKSASATFRTNPRLKSWAVVKNALRACFFEPQQPNVPQMLSRSMTSVVLRFNRQPSEGNQGFFTGLLADYVVDNYCRKHKHEVYMITKASATGHDESSPHTVEVPWGLRVGQDCKSEESFCVISSLTPGTAYELRVRRIKRGNRSGVYIRICGVLSLLNLQCS